MDDVVTEVLGDTDSGDHLFADIHRDGGFEVAPPGRSGPPDTVGARNELVMPEESMAVSGITSPHR
ncbi:MAG: hypothetical protein LUO93_08690 [Methanomicrobiales archaeon]|nr:hypothetical protein [Methanomicrobiales archaeon]